MPIYEYCCRDCEQIFEKWQRDFNDRILRCPVCGGDAARIVSQASFVLKGTGWYVTDYGKNGSSTPRTASSASSSTATPQAKTTDTAVPVASSVAAS